MRANRKVVLAYSGGLDTSAVIPYLTEQGYEVIAVAVDVGQPGDLQAAVDRAPQLGAAGQGNDQVHFEASLGAVAPGIEVLAPVRDWGMTREDTITYAEER